MPDTLCATFERRVSGAHVGVVESTVGFHSKCYFLRLCTSILYKQVHSLFSGKIMVCFRSTEEHCTLVSGKTLESRRRWPTRGPRHIHTHSPLRCRRHRPSKSKVPEASLSPNRVFSRSPHHHMHCIYPGSPVLKDESESRTTS